MCTQYINANVALFRGVNKINNEVIAFSEPFDCITVDCSNKVVSIKDFNIVTYINLMESKDKKANNVLDRRDTLQVRIRLTKCIKDEDERLSVDLDDFQIVTKDSKDIFTDACVPYMNYKRITHVENIDLDIEHPRGNYVIKVLVREPNDEKFTVQSLYHLKVE